MSKESDFVDLLNKEMYELKIANLEAKLAESEEQLKEELVEKKCLERALSACNRQNDEFSDMIKKLVKDKEELKQQLEKSEKSKESYRLQNEHHHLQLLQFYSRLGVEAFGADIHEKALETLMIMKEQLAEKDKEIEYYKKQVKKFNNEAQKYFEDAYCNDSIYQDKISFCIERLEKVKETTECILDNALKNSSLNQSYYDRLLDEIDNQIKQLKVKAERS